MAKKKKCKVQVNLISEKWELQKDGTWKHTKY